MDSILRLTQVTNTKAITIDIPVLILSNLAMEAKSVEKMILIIIHDNQTKNILSNMLLDPEGVAKSIMASNILDSILVLSSKAAKDSRISDRKMTFIGKRSNIMANKASTIIMNMEMKVLRMPMMKSMISTGTKKSQVMAFKKLVRHLSRTINNLKDANLHQERSSRATTLLMKAMSKGIQTHNFRGNNSKKNRGLLNTRPVSKQNYRNLIYRNISQAKLKTMETKKGTRCIASGR